jgi:hypothetical protein
MKKLFLFFLLSSVFVVTPVFAKTTSPSVTWKVVTPDGYTPITWAKAPGIATFFKAPSGNGSIDFITRIYLPQNQIQFIGSSSTPLDWGSANPNFTPGNTVPIDPVVSDTYANDPFNLNATTTVATVTSSVFHNFAFARLVAEMAKEGTPDVQFVWNGPFFNVTVPTSDLSLALKTTVGTTTLITSGSRPAADMAKERRMLIINNQTASGLIANFDQTMFVSSTLGDQALEGFAPSVVKTDSTSAATGRLFLGVTPNGKELVVYCSQQATVDEASAELSAAGIAPEQQLEADGGGSAACGYNLPGQFFVEPSRTLPLLMGAVTVMARGTATTDGLNVRSGPATKYPIVTKLPKGTAVRVFEQKNGWFRIGTGQWVLGTLIKKI